MVLAATGTGNALTQPSSATDSNGQTAGTLASTRAEVKTVSVTIGGTVISNTATVTFTPGALDHFTVSSIPTQTAGVPFNIGLTAQDVNNNTVTNYTGEVDLATTAGSITPTISAAFTAGVLSSQSVSVTLAGTGKTITVTDHGGTKTGTSGTFTVLPSPWTISPSRPSAVRRWRARRLPWPLQLRMPTTIPSRASGARWI